ncbi:MAG: DNA primase catalytic subunit PriS [Methanobacteriota archaeon]
MGETEGEAEATARFLREAFRRYYVETRPILPDRFGRREFGFMFWSAGIVQRHLGFAKEDDLRAFLRSRVPAHVYYSSAYYETPGAATMEDKGWLGADLIFDLDADHIPSAKQMTYAEMLEAVKVRIAKLYDDFLVADFGFEEARMRLVFSGGRGYHVHVFDERVWSLGSHERREIVDWITAKGIDVDAMFRESAFDAREFKEHRSVKKKVVPPSRADPGWPGKVARGIEELTHRLEGLAPEDAIRFIGSFEGVTTAEAEDLYENLFKVRTTTPRVIRGVDRVREGQLEALADRPRNLLRRIVVDLQQVRLDEFRGVPMKGITQRGETDEPVTSDIKRLIRMPSSLHGKTGLAVVALSRDALEDFVPLRDAVPPTWTDEPTEVRVANGITLEMHDETFNLGPGQRKVPQYLAIFLAARGLARLVTEV